MGLGVKQLTAGLKAGTIDAQKFGNAMSDSLVEKGKKPLEAMGNELGTLKTKLGETLSHLFDGIDTAPITDVLKSVIDLGDQGEPSGQALKDGLKGGINAIVQEIGHLVHEAEIMFLDLEIGWLKNKPVIMSVIDDVKALASAFGDVLGIVGKIGGAIGGAAGAVKDFVGKVAFMGENSQLDVEARERAGLDPGGHKLPGHARGGIVTGIHGGVASVRAADGEGLASIGHGERIVPRDSYRNVSRTSVANDNSQASSNTVHIAHLHIEAPSGVTHAHEVTVTGLTLALERLQLASGR